MTGRVGVVFSSGFFGFFAHAGFLSALREAGIRPCGYSGASSGALVAAMAAAGMSEEAVAEHLFGVRKDDFWDPDSVGGLLRHGLRLFRGYTGYLKGDRFRHLLEGLPVTRFEECAVPLAVAVTNLTDRCTTIFTHGSLPKALQASSAVPVLFKPVHIHGRMYVDGGVTTKAPVRALADLVACDRIIVHFIGSGNLKGPGTGSRKEGDAVAHQSLASNIARVEAYREQVAAVRERGIEVIEIRTGSPPWAPAPSAGDPRRTGSHAAPAWRALTRALEPDLNP